jgi:hypothetical protein
MPFPHTVKNDSVICDNLIGHIGRGSNFLVESSPQFWNDPNNPVEGYDTERSVIRKILKNF